MIKCCIFDLDGTILDTIHSITYFVNYAHKHFGIPEITVDECKYFAGNGAKTLIDRSTSSRGVADREFVNEVWRYYVDAYDNVDPYYLTCPFDGMKEVLSALKKKGIKLAVISNKPDQTTKTVVKHFFGDIFDVVEGGREGMPLKPDPTLPNIVMEKLGATGAETAFVGDTSTDMETGKNIGASLKIGCLWGFRKIEELIESGADVFAKESADILRAIEEHV